MADERDEPDEEREPAEGVKIVDDEEPALRFGPDDTGPLPHWTEPPTGEVPQILADEPHDDVDPWSSFSGQAPVWRDDQSEDANAGPRPHAPHRGPAAGRSRRRRRALRHRRGLPARRAPATTATGEQARVTPIRTRREAPNAATRPTRHHDGAARWRGRPGSAHGHRGGLRPRRALPAAAELRRALRRGPRRRGPGRGRGRVLRHGPQQGLPAGSVHRPRRHHRPAPGRLLGRRRRPPRAHRAGLHGHGGLGHGLGQRGQRAAAQRRHHHARRRLHRPAGLVRGADPALPQQLGQGRPAGHGRRCGGQRHRRAVRRLQRGPHSGGGVDQPQQDGGGRWSAGRSSPSSPSPSSRS